MPNFNLLIFPLLGAFYFIENNHFYKLKYSLLDRQRYIYTTFLFGLYLIIPSFLTVEIVKFIFPELEIYIKEYVHLKGEFLGSSLGAFFLGVLSTHIHNKSINKAEITKKLIGKYGGVVEKQLLECFTEEELLLFTLKNDKIYIGFVSEIEFSLENPYIKMDPVFSGYRDKFKKMTLTTDYLEAFETFESFSEKDEKKQVSAEKNPIYFTKLLVRKDDIITLSKFDLELYFAFNEIDQKDLEVKPESK